MKVGKVVDLNPVVGTLCFGDLRITQLTIGVGAPAPAPSLQIHQAHASDTAQVLGPWAMIENGRYQEMTRIPVPECTVVAANRPTAQNTVVGDPAEMVLTPG